jgi:hypothetical protein
MGPLLALLPEIGSVVGSLVDGATATSAASAGGGGGGLAADFAGLLEQPGKELSQLLEGLIGGSNNEQSDNEQSDNDGQQGGGSPI